ncbi:PINIT domain-containing protein [Apiospora phragmitis]|uniref:PINIT domain-containing protein n=1 Tax=Apiospora phragmitis TaxID=2905665 RepID=A0ABR1TRH6_9PEZI
MASSTSAREIQSLSVQLGHMLNKQLQSICQINGLKTSGIKADLQKRIIEALQENLHADPALYAQLRSTIQNMSSGGRGGHQAHQNNGASTTGSSRGSAYGTTPGIPPHAAPTFSNGFAQYAPYGANRAFGGASAQGASKAMLQFKPSPFYTIVSPNWEYPYLRCFSRPSVLESSVLTGDAAMAQHRNSIHFALKASDHPSLLHCAHDKTTRVMVFCAAEDQGIQEVAFPHQSELKVNGGEIKANLRGLKGKPGSTRPVDITSSLRLDKHSYVNNVEFTYALTQKVKTNPRAPVSHSNFHHPSGDKHVPCLAILCGKRCSLEFRMKFFLTVYLCRAVPVEELVAKIQGRRIQKDSVIQELTKAANDPDVVATSQVLSLKCPLSYTRLRAPCRSTSCSHIQCFDATSYLQLQEQGPQWICPICNKSATFENLAIDQYAKDILDHTSESTEQVTIEPDGQWRAQASSEPEPKRPRYSSGVNASVIDDDDDDVVPLDSFSLPSARNTQTPNQSLFGTPGPAQGNGSASSGSRKRPAEVIDLTLSDDEDNEPVRAPKCQNAGQTPSLGPNIPKFQYS